MVKNTYLDSYKHRTSDVNSKDSAFQKRLSQAKVIAQTITGHYQQDQHHGNADTVEASVNDSWRNDDTGPDF